MPIYLEPKDVTSELEPFGSVLIVCCLICPPMSLAMQKKQPLVDVFKYGFKFKAFDDYVASIRETLEKRGVRTGVYSKFAPLPFICLWTEGQRNRLLECAKEYEAVLVLGCNSAQITVEDVLKDTDCKIIPGMRMRAVANATTKFRFPLKVDLILQPLKKKRRGDPHGDTGDAEMQREKEAS